MPEDGFERLCAEISGLDIVDFLRAAVHGTGELPLEPLLRSHGIEFHLRRSAGSKDKGGKASANGNLPDVWLGAELVDRQGKPVFNAVHNGGPAERAGIAPGDELVALDGLRINVAGTETRTRRYKPGDKSKVTVFRGDELMTLRLKWDEAPSDTCYLLVADDVDEDTLARRRAWLGS
jgi:predicted metalloprotease with PDZ domain